MSATWNHSTGDGYGLNASELFNVILVYEDRASAQRGLALYQRLMNDLGVECEFNLNVWKFAVLGLARLDEISTEQAAAADLVIVCTRHESEPNEQVQAWFSRWLELKGHNDCALVVLGDGAQDSSALARRGGFYHRLAQRGAVACFSPATVSAFAARVPGREWLPRQPHGSGVDGWNHADRRLPFPLPCSNQPPTSRN